MDNQDIHKVRGKRGLAHEIATRSTDPNFYAALEVLPNPDVILRKLGKRQEVYADIMGDAHVIGELRSIRAGMLGFEWRLTPGGDESADDRAFEICQQVMQQQPAPGLQWSDTIWNMACAIFRGYAVHEVVWKRFEGLLLPEKIIDRPHRRFVFGLDNELRLLTKENQIEGIELGDKKWLVTRHMASFDNPYGVAVFSNCFWPYVFKHSGFKYFAKFCERYGLPWVVGKYPPGTPQPEQDALADALAQMVEDAVAAIPNDGSIELLETKHSGQLVHERLIDLCNREISKALTSQTLATEIQGQGSRAASETHRERETTVNQSDRAIIEYSMNELFRWITELNVAGATPPKFEFYEEAQANGDMVDFLNKANEKVPIKRTEYYERLQLSQPDEGDDVIEVSASTPPAPAASPEQEFARWCQNCGTHHYAQGDTNDPITQLADQALEHSGGSMELIIDPIKQLLDESEDLHEFQRKLAELYPALDDSGLGDLLKQTMLVSRLQGMDEVS